MPWASPRWTTHYTTPCRKYQVQYPPPPRCPQRMQTPSTTLSPSAGIWLALLAVILPTSFKLGSLPVARECIPKHSCLPSQASGLLGTCSCFHGVLACMTGCAQLLKCFDENAFVLKSSINTKSRPGRGGSRILPVSAVTKGSGQRENGNGGGASPVQ